MSILKDLRMLSRKQGSVEDIAEFTKQLHNESNDRGAALLAVTNADVALSAALYQRLRIGEAKREEFDKLGGPLETFSQRIMMGEVLQIYGPDTKYNLDLLRLLRNTFAHAHIPVTFETKEIAASIQLFKPLPLKLPHAVGADAKPVPAGSRDRFLHHCEIVTHNLGVWAFYGVLPVSEVHLPPGYFAFSQPKPMP
ncbi:hypothetical protein [Bradyrhizobium sp. Ash2021]|uniref:hypothetical protein n=1 Tax=Bradyrhizobium sp. Ash2021 TaxID=2954771 RepID=UPI002815F552|nr:hypothetical protein [Bradyrhizobium sp. Ash2021]WMT71062.1 hypothetical protein NL528_23430 [Bradyrhizobium sp. Ash2021]